MQHISILGCGWLGLPLASHFIKEGFGVAGSTTSTSNLEKLANNKIEAYHIHLPDKIESSFFDKAEYLIIDIPPQSRTEGKDFHKKSIEAIVPYIKAHQKIIYISATSVYADIDQVIDENSPLNEGNERSEALIQAENLLRQTFGDRLTILRLGGLLGYDRIPGKYTAGKSSSGGEEKVNYIHRDDAVQIISQVIKQQQWGKTLNAVAPKHPKKKEVYQKNSAQFHFDYTIFKDSDLDKKSRYINGAKLELLLDYTFIYPDPLHFHYTI